MHRSTAPSTIPRPVAAWMQATFSSSIERDVKIVILAEAQRQFETQDDWWREHRDAKELFVDEFEQTLALLSSTPEIGRAYRCYRASLLMVEAPAYSMNIGGRRQLRRSRELAHSRLLEVVHFAVQDREHDRQRKQPPTASPSSFASPRQHRRKQQRPRR